MYVHIYIYIYIYTYIHTYIYIYIHIPDVGVVINPGSSNFVTLSYVTKGHELHA